MKISFYVDLKNYENIDLRNLENGNPGIGGTEYCFLLLINQLELSTSNHQFTLIHNSNNSILPAIDSKYVSNLFEAIEYNELNAYDILVFRPIQKQEVYDLLNYKDVKAITWGHNFYRAGLARMISECDNVVRNVFVSRQLYDRMIDHDISEKSVYIFNGINCEVDYTREIIEKQTVTFLSAIEPNRGFHIVAKQWKKVLKHVPDAELLVIGNGMLYSEDIRLGTFGIAKDSYEKKFMKYLLNENGEILPSVKFLGKLGGEKNQVFEKTKIGIVNPIGRETFCLSAIEMGLFKIPVITKGNHGLLDTVRHNKTGYHITRKRELSKYIIRLLHNDDLNNALGENGYKFIVDNFDIKVVSNCWIELLDSCNQEKNTFVKPNSFLLKDFKCLRLIIRYLRFDLRLRKFPSFIDFESYIYKILKRRN